jgi:hypothetical protein
MKKTFLTITIIGAATIAAHAGDVLYQSDFKNMKTGQDIFAAGEDNSRSRLFPDAKPAVKTQLTPKKNRFSGRFTASIAQADSSPALKITAVKGKKFPFKKRGNLLLELPDAGKKVTVELSVKCENYLKSKYQNYFFALVGGANIWFRGDSKDFRYYNADSKRYERLFKLTPGKWYNLKIVLSYGDKSLFDLYVNGKELLKDKVQRGEPSSLKIINFSFSSQQNVSTDPQPSIYLKNIKVVNN